MPNLLEPRVCYCREGDYYSAKYAGCVRGDPCANMAICAQHEGGSCEYLSERLFCKCPFWLKGENCQETVPKWTWTEWTICEETCGECNQTRSQICIDHRGQKLDSTRCGYENDGEIEINTTKQLPACDKNWSFVEYLVIILLLVAGILFVCFLIFVFKALVDRTCGSNNSNRWSMSFPLELRSPLYY